MSIRSGRWGPEILLFLALIASRAAWIFGHGPGGLEPPDLIEYEALAERIAAGNFDMGLYRFIRPPGLPLLIACAKYLAPFAWKEVLLGLNLFFSVGSGVLLYALTRLTYEGPSAARWAALLYVVHLPLMAFASTVSTEPAYLFFTLATLTTFQVLVRDASLGAAGAFAAAAYLAALFRATILAGAPAFVGAMIVLSWARGRAYLKASLAAAVLFLLFSAPFGLLNLHVHGQYVISSNGSGFMFLNGNSEVGYQDSVAYGRLSDEEKYYVMNFSEYGSRFFGQRYEAALALPQRERQAEFRAIAWDWIRENPAKFLATKAANFGRLLLPGRSFQHVPFREWLLSVLLALPAYLLCYVELARQARSWRSEPAQRRWLLAFFLITAAALVAYLYTYRYKVYALEFLYLLYAGASAERVWRWCAGKWLESPRPTR